MSAPKPEEIIVGRDCKGQKLCTHCWNGEHYSREQHLKTGKPGRKISMCLQGQCECGCRALLAEKHPRIKRDTSQQITIEEVAGTIDV